MRSIFILAISGTLLLLPGVSSAETNAECMSNCTNEKAARDTSCPPRGEDYDSRLENARCMKESQEAYSSCVKTCPPPEPVAKPEEN